MNINNFKRVFTLAGYECTIYYDNIYCCDRRVTISKPDSNIKVARIFKWTNYSKTQLDFIESLISDYEHICNVEERKMKYEHTTDEYIRRDVENAMRAYELLLAKRLPTPTSSNNSLQIKNVIFADPATIVFWEDGTKTVVKSQNEAYDPEKGLAMAISKKALGNKHDYFIVFKKWLKKVKG